MQWPHSLEKGFCDWVGKSFLGTRGLKGSDSLDLAFGW